MLLYRTNIGKISFILSKKIVVIIGIILFLTQNGKSTTNADCLTDSQLENVKSTVNIYKIRGSIHTKEKELIENCFGKGLKLCRDQRYDEAKKHLEIVKEAMEYPQFYFYYGLSCQKSNPPDYQKAFEAYKIAIEELPAARLNLANLYQQGLGTVKNEREAFKLLLKNYYYFDKKLEDCKSINNSNKYKVYISEVLKDDLDSYISNNYLLGMAHLNGTGTKVNYKSAIQCLEEATKFDDAEAYLGLASIYYDGLGVKRSFQKAFELYKKASNLGNLTGKAAYADFLMECTGNVCEKNLEKAAALLNEITSEKPEFWEHYLELSTLYFYHLDDSVENELLGVEYAINHVKKLKESHEFNSNTIKGIHHLINILVYLIEEGKSIEELKEQVAFFDSTLTDLKKDLVEILKSKIVKNKEYKSVAYYLSSMVAFNEKEYYKALDLLNTSYLRGYDDPSGLFEKINAKIQEENEEEKKDSIKSKKSTKIIIPKNLIKKEEGSREIDVKFLNDNVKEDYNALDKAGKLSEILKDLKSYNIWETKGVGKPEVLKGKYEGIKGAISRRLDEKNRLIYQVIDKGVIRILSCKGHYNE